MSRSPVPGLLVCVALVGVITLFPYDFHAGAAHLLRAETSDTAPTATILAREFILNTLLFAPAGALLYRALRVRVDALAAVLAAGAVGLLASGAIESLQWFIPQRDPSLLDLTANTAGAFAGALGQRWWDAALAARVQWFRTRLLLAARISAMALFTFGALLVSAAMQRDSRISEWNAEYPLIVGNEATGDRPWRGRLYRFELTDAPMSYSALAAFSSGEPFVWPQEPVAAFEFTGGAPFRDVSGHVPPLRWTDPAHAGAVVAGVSLSGQAWLRTDGSASALARRVQRANAFTLRVVCATDAVTQRGPARVVSNSIDVNRRNFTIGQRGQDMVVRIRTAHTGPNGFHPEIVVPGVFVDTDRRDILVTYDGATLLAAVAGSGVVHQTDLTPGSRLALAVTSLNIDAGQLWILQLVYIVLLSAGGGLVLLLLEAPGRTRAIAGVSWAVAFALLLEVVLVLASGRAFHVSNVAYTMVTGMVVLAALGVAAPAAPPAGTSRP